mgnify:CR=1 FL=1
MKQGIIFGLIVTTLSLVAIVFMFDRNSDLNLDLVIWLVSPHNPLKDKDSLMPLKERLKSAKNIASSKHFVVTDVEKTIKTQCVLTCSFNLMPKGLSIISLYIHYYV